TSFASDPQHAPSTAILREAAKGMLEDGYGSAARQILESAFTREIDDHQITIANMLGLAEIRIATKDLQGAVDLLHRMTLVAGEPFTGDDQAAALLVKTGHSAEAIPFLNSASSAQPWNVSFKVRLAQAQIAASANVDATRDAL